MLAVGGEEGGVGEGRWVIKSWEESKGIAVWGF